MINLDTNIIREIMNYILFGGFLWLIKRLIEKVEKLTVGVAVLESKEQEREEKGFCKPIHLHETEYHGKVIRAGTGEI